MEELDGFNHEARGSPYRGWRARGRDAEGAQRREASSVTQGPNRRFQPTSSLARRRYERMQAMQ